MEIAGQARNDVSGIRHCEEQSDEAIQFSCLDRHASLAMTYFDTVWFAMTNDAHGRLKMMGKIIGLIITIIVFILILAYGIDFLAPGGLSETERARIAVTEAVVLESETFLNPKMVAAGYNHTTLIDAEGNLWIWGFGDYGRLGTGNNRTRRLPIKIMENMAMVTAGGAHTLALDELGTLWGWGHGHRGQNGVSIIVSKNRPGKIMDDVVYITAGNEHSAAIKSDGSLWTWGNNQIDQLGNGTGVVTAEPQRIMENVIQVAAGKWATFALQADGSVWHWGGTGRPRKPERIEIENVIFISQGYAVTSDCRLWQLSPKENQVILNNVVSVNAGPDHAFAIRTDGSLWAWGKNANGQLGDGTRENRDEPIKVMDNVASISAGENHTIVVKHDGTISTFGNNTHGQLGNATEDAFDGGLWAVISAFFGAIWASVVTSLYVVMIIYNLLTHFLPGFIGFSASHVWWHNLLLAVFWIGGYFVFAYYYYKFASWVRQSFQNTVYEKYEINIFPAWHWFFYLIAVLIIPSIRYFELSSRFWIFMIVFLIGIPQLDLLIKGKGVSYPFLLLRQAAIVVFYILGFYIFSVMALIMAVVLLFALIAAKGLLIGASGGPREVARGSNVCPHCAFTMSQKGTYCPCGKSYNAYAYDTPRAADDFPKPSI